jgi:[Skp1-protein]-hydroxyproline N-acetylglucosaminyltransferase
MCLKEFSKVDNLPRFSSRVIKKPDHFQKPFESLFWAAGFSFSYGNLISDCGYTDEVDDVFFGEELYMMFKFVKSGYQLYSPPVTLSYHLWERSYRKTYKEDHIKDAERQVNQQKCIQFIKDIILSDEDFLQEMMNKRGVDIKS